MSGQQHDEFRRRILQALFELRQTYRPQAPTNDPGRRRESTTPSRPQRPRSTG